MHTAAYAQAYTTLVKNCGTKLTFYLEPIITWHSITYLITEAYLDKLHTVFLVLNSTCTGHVCTVYSSCCTQLLSTTLAVKNMVVPQNFTTASAGHKYILFIMHLSQFCKNELQAQYRFTYPAQYIAKKYVH